MQHLQMNKLCQLLGVNSPIVQEPIHTLTNGKLIAAISEAGSLGILGINAGYHAPDALTGASASSSDQVGKTGNNYILDAMQERNLMNEQIDYVLAHTFRPFAIEIPSSASIPEQDHTAMELVELMRKRRLTIALFEGFGQIASKEWVQLLHHNGIKVMQTVSQTDRVKQAQKNGIDILIYPQKEGLLEFVHEAHATPVLAGCDTANPNVLTHALACGAQGVFLKTVFAASEEAPTATSIKNALIKAKNSDLVSFKLNNRTIFSLPGKLPNHLAKMTAAGIDAAQITAASHGYQGLINGMLKGDLNLGYTDIAEDIDFITVNQSVKEIVNQINNSQK